MLDTFLNEMRAIETRFDKTGDLDILERELSAFAAKYSAYFGVGDALLRIGDAYFEQGDDKIGFIFVKAVAGARCQVANKTMLCLRMAQYHLENGAAEAGEGFLLKLCTETVDNYEESIAANGLTSVWEKYKHLVAGRVPRSVNTSALSPEQCSVRIEELFKLSDEELPAALSAHLAELSANGEALNLLNQWERRAFYVDELCIEVNSGGFGHYLYYCGHRYEKAKNALETIGAHQTQGLLDKIASKFPHGRIPKKIESIQNALDAMEEQGIDFEKEDEHFYDTAEKELLRCLLHYVKENRHHFR